MYDDDRDALAAEYVLGTLSGDEREQAEALLVIDPGFAEIVRQWERRLGELNVMVEAVEPAPEVWERIRAEIAGGDTPSAAEETTALPAIEEPAPQTAPEEPPESLAEMPVQPVADWMPAPALDLDQASTPPAPQLDLGETQDTSESPPQEPDDSAAVAALASSLLGGEPAPETRLEPVKPPTPPTAAPPRTERSAEIIQLARAARRWRRLTVLAGALAAVLALYIGVGQFAPGLVPLPRPTQSATSARPQAPASRYVAVLQHDPTSPGFLLTLDAQNRTITVRRVAAGAESDRSYELWLVSSKYQTPRSLGLVGGEEFTARPVPASYDMTTLRGGSFAISLEPTGGSPSGVPTGPILFTGKLVETLPGSAS
jgi:anti-sigma-K factor RskA